MKRSRAALAAEAAKATSEPRTPKQELLLKRRNRRKVDFKTLSGVLRESTRNYLDLLNGAISLEQAECKGRAIARHAEILKSHKQEGQIATLIEELKAVRGDARLGWNVDEIE